MAGRVCQLKITIVGTEPCASSTRTWARFVKSQYPHDTLAPVAALHLPAPGLPFAYSGRARPAIRERAARPSAVPGQWERIASGPAARTTDRNTAAVMMASSA